MVGRICKAYIVIEVAIQAQNIGMPEMRLDFHLSAQLVLYVRVAKLILEKHLQTDGVSKTCLDALADDLMCLGLCKACHKAASPVETGRQVLQR